MKESYKENGITHYCLNIQVKANFILNLYVKPPTSTSNSFSTAALISLFVAVIATLNTIVFAFSAAIVAFAEMCEHVELLKYALQ